MRYIINIDPRLEGCLVDLPDLKVIPDTVHLQGEITEESAAQLRRDIEVAESMALRNGQEILPLMIDSPGGDAYATMSIIDAIDNCSLSIATIVEGRAMSGAIDVLVCGTEGLRFCGPNATLMVHGVMSGSMGTLAEMEADIKEFKRVQKILMENMNKRCGKKKNYFENILKKLDAPDWFMGPEEAQKHNIINHIKIPTIQVDIGLSYTFK